MGLRSTFQAWVNYQWSGLRDSDQAPFRVLQARMANLAYDTPHNRQNSQRQHEDSGIENNRRDQIIREVQPLLHMTPPSVCVKGLDGCSHVAPSQTRIREKQVILTTLKGCLVSPLDPHCSKFPLV